MSILKRIKFIIVKLLRRLVFGPSSTSESFINMLRKEGIKIGQGTIFFDPINTIVDTQNPKLLSIGDNVRVTSGVKILTHDFSWSVIAGVYGECVGAIGKVNIGDNVFIGVNTIILRDTKIGNNVIIGAGSVVRGICEDNSVYAGNPAKRIMTLDEFYLKRVNKRNEEITNILNEINTDRYDEIWKYMREYSCYFTDAPKDIKKQIMNDSGYREKCEDYYLKNISNRSIEDFIKNRR